MAATVEKYRAMGARGLTATMTPSSCRLLLDLPDAELLGTVEVGVDGRADALDLLFERLARNRVLAPGEVAHHVEGLEPFELREQFATAVGLVAGPQPSEPDLDTGVNRGWIPVAPRLCTAVFG